LDDFLELSVPYHQVTVDQVNRFKRLLETNPKERFIQAFLDENKEIVGAYLGAHAVYVASKPRFGTHYEADFAVAECNSAGTFWYLIELEQAGAKPFKKNGRPTAPLTHAIEQIKEWRRFIESNLDYCRRSRRKNGLGLEDISPRSSGVIIMGRDEHYSDEPDQWRKKLIEDEHIYLRSYDGFIKWPSELANRNANQPPVKTVMIDGKAYLDIATMFPGFKLK
jgi:hypothetical protein